MTNFKGVKYYSSRRLWKAYIEGRHIGWFKSERHAQLARLMWEPVLQERKQRFCSVCGIQFLRQANKILCGSIPNKTGCVYKDHIAKVNHHYALNKLAIRKERRETYYSNHSHITANRRANYSKNADKFRKLAREWHQNHKRPYSSDNYQKHILTFTRSRHLYRARRLGLVGTFTKRDLAIMFKTYAQCCVGCSQFFPFLTLDHKVPVSKGGTNFPDNFQPLCKKCNSSKHTKIMFAAQRLSDRTFHLAEWREFPV